MTSLDSLQQLLKDLPEFEQMPPNDRQPSERD